MRLQGRLGLGRGSGPHGQLLAGSRQGWSDSLLPTSLRPTGAPLPPRTADLPRAGPNPRLSMPNRMVALKLCVVVVPGTAPTPSRQPGPGPPCMPPACHVAQTVNVEASGCHWGWLLSSGGPAPGTVQWGAGSWLAVGGGAQCPLAGGCIAAGPAVFPGHGHCWPQWPKSIRPCAGEGVGAVPPGPQGLCSRLMSAEQSPTLAWGVSAQASLGLPLAPVLRLP